MAGQLTKGKASGSLVVSLLLRISQTCRVCVSNKEVSVVNLSTSLDFSFFFGCIV